MPSWWALDLGFCALELEVTNFKWGSKEPELWIGLGLGVLTSHPQVAHHTPPLPLALPRTPQGEAGGP